MNFELCKLAQERIRKYLFPTPLVHSQILSEKLGADVWLKLENLQPTGSFKVRPAFNGILSHYDAAKKLGVVTSSSGNFAQAVAYVAGKLGVHARIVMMESTSPLKIENTKRFGAEVILCGNSFQERWDTTFRVQKETGSVFLHPYDSEETISADATIGMEVYNQLQAFGAAYAYCVLTPVSGGGLAAGVSLALKNLDPSSTVYGVQPKANGSMLKSLQAGKPVTVPAFKSVADALVATVPGNLSFELVQKHCDGALLVEEPAIVSAVDFLARGQKLIVEAGGAVGVAAIQSGLVPVAEKGYKNIVCVITGGNRVLA